MKQDRTNSSAPELSMMPKSVLFTSDQMQFLDEYRKEGGNPSQLVRVALDREIKKRKERGY